MTFYRNTESQRAARWLLTCLLACLFALMPQLGRAQESNVKFDHLKTGYPLSGMHSTLRCESCHSNGIFKGTPRDCQTCHSLGTRFSRANVVMPANHIPVKQGCDSCHNTQTFTGARFTHTAVLPGTCQLCHDGMRVQGKTAGHVPTRAACDTCHNNTNSWSGARPDHSTFNLTTNCVSCHNGSAATGKTSNHIPVAANCISCHSVTVWRPSSWNHTQTLVTNACSTCHSGAFSPADGRPSNHIPYQSLTGAAISNCDSCHKGGYSSWNTGRFHPNVNVNSQCATCHLTSAYGLTSKPANATHSAVTGGCEACHNTNGWAGARVDHSRFNVATQCTTCHNGGMATGKPGNHIPVTANCVSCHNVRAWTPTAWNHTQVTVTNACSNCHTGAFPPADGRPSNHIPYQSLTGVAISNCDSCHKTGYTSWNPGRFHTNLTVTNQCATCHLSKAYGLTSKPANALHASIITNCESCHRSTSSWTVVSFAHSPANAVGTGTCDTCHNGSTAKGKPGSHVPVLAGGAKCDACHKSQQAWTISVRTNHSAVSAQTCKGCHIATYVTAGATVKPNNHIPEGQLLNGSSMDCGSCHSNTNAGGFSSATMNHNNSQGNGSGWCYACHNSGTGYLGSMERMALQHRRPNPPAMDCSQSGCHRPLGTKGSPYRNWN